jgi:DNA-binding NarL/FixJ family response regulator
MPKAKVLIVDDDAFLAVTMQQLLTLIDFDVVGVAASVNDALCLAENTHPDLAIFDVRLAGRRDGIEGAAILRDRLGLSVVFVTARGEPATRRRAAIVEPVAYLEKPVHARRLIKAVEKAAAMNRDPVTNH